MDKYVKKRVYRVKKKLGGVDAFLGYPLSEDGSVGLSEFLSLRFAGQADGNLKSVRVDLPMEKTTRLLQLGEREELKPGRVFSCHGYNQSKLWFLELYLLSSEEFLQKPWEFRVYTGEGEELELSEPIRVRLSDRNLKNLFRAVRLEMKSA